VKQREDDSQCSKMMLRFREDKIKRLESVASGFLSADAFLVQEKNALVEELQLVQGRLDRNPELTRFAMENIRLLEQLRRYRNLDLFNALFHISPSFLSNEVAGSEDIKPTVV
jgi:kinesin family protein 15